MHIILLFILIILGIALFSIAIYHERRQYQLYKEYLEARRKFNYLSGHHPMWEQTTTTWVTQEDKND